MSTDLVKGSKALLAERGEGSVGRAVGKSAAVTGVSGLAVWGVAGVLPFITLPMLLVMLVLGGGALYLKNS
jgi:hypothetical protein